jgi:hypothetical protein
MTLSWLLRFLGAVSREEMAGLAIREPRWAISSESIDPSRFLGSLLTLVPVGVLLFLEGGAHPPALRRFLERHALTDVSSRPALGTAWPRHAYFTLRALPGFIEELARLTASLPSPEICDHLHVFNEEQVLLEGYDAFAQPFLASGLLSEDRLRRFCEVAGCRYYSIEKAGIVA